MATGNTISAKLADIQASKTALISAIQAQGVTVPTGAKLADLAILITAISTDITPFRVAWECDSSLLTSLSVPDGIQKIGSNRFSGFARLQTVTFADSVKMIDMFAFSGCKALQSLDIPSSVTTLEAGAFSQCTSLTSVKFNGSVTLMGTVFKGCTALTTFYLSKGSVGYSVCEGCTGLTSITLGSGVSFVDSDAFKGCTAVETLSIFMNADSATIGSNAFSGIPASCQVNFYGLKASIQAMENYPWGLASGTPVHTNSGDFTIA